MFRDADISSCRAINPGSCVDCPKGWYKNKGQGADGAGSDACEICEAGKEATSDQKSCQFCDFAEQPASSSGDVIRRYKAQAGPEFCRDSGLVEGNLGLDVKYRLAGKVTSRRHPRPVSSGIGTQCGKRRFPNKLRDGCREIVNVTILAPISEEIKTPPSNRPYYSVEGLATGGFNNHDDVTVKWGSNTRSRINGTTT
jgi:hypothetical protein